MGTSIPRRENELKGSPPSPLKEYTLSPEELAKIIGKPIPKSHTKPIGFETKTSVPKIEKEVKDMPKVNKEEYLALRAQGVSRKEAAKKLGTSKQSLETYWFGKWGIKNDAGEEVEIARFKESRRESRQEPAAPPEPQVHTVEMQESVQPQMIDFEVKISGESSREDIPSLPVRLTLEQVNALKLVLQHKLADEIVLLHSQTIIITHERWKEDLEPLNDLTMDELIRALYFGYEIAKTPEELLLQEFQQAEARYGADSAAIFRTGLQLAAEIFGHKVVGVNA